MISITSPNNPKIKLARALKQRKAREESGLFVVEGIRHTGEAFEAGAEFVSLWVAPELLKSDYAKSLVEQLEGRGVPVYTLAAEVFETLAEKDNPQGILAVLRQPLRGIDQLQPANFPWGAALVSPQDPGNIGTILRTLDAVGAAGLILLEQPADLYHPSAVRASMGALFWLPTATASFAEFHAWARRHGYILYGTSAHGSLPYEQMQEYRRPAILVLGSEREGLTAEQSAACDYLVRLPMKGHATSLNLAVAAGVMLYEMLLKG